MPFYRKNPPPFSRLAYQWTALKLQRSMRVYKLLIFCDLRFLCHINKDPLHSLRLSRTCLSLRQCGYEVVTFDILSLCFILSFNKNLHDECRSSENEIMTETQYRKIYTSIQRYIISSMRNGFFIDVYLHFIIH